MNLRTISHESRVMYLRDEVDPLLGELRSELYETVRLLWTLLEREEKMGRRGDAETADWIRKRSMTLMKLEAKIAGEE